MRFYVVVKKPKGTVHFEQFRTDFTYGETVRTGEAPKCPSCGAYVGMLQVLPPYQVHLETWGEDFGDLAFWLSEFLVTRRFRDEYQRSGLAGLTGFEPAVVASHTSRGAAKGLPPQYFNVMPRIGSARIDADASRVEWEGDALPSCNLCLAGASGRKRWDSIVIDENSWNGDDVFYAYGMPGVLVVSRRFFEWAQRQEFRNLVMKPADEYSSNS